MWITGVFCPQFAVLLSLIIVVEIAAAIAGYVFRNKVSWRFWCLIGIRMSLLSSNSKDFCPSDNFKGRVFGKKRLYIEGIFKVKQKKISSCLKVIVSPRARKLFDLKFFSKDIIKKKIFFSTCEPSFRFIPSFIPNMQICSFFRNKYKICLIIYYIVFCIFICNQKLNFRRK